MSTSRSRSGEEPAQSTRLLESWINAPVEEDD